jgi:UDP-galactopyranose mutase
MRVLVVGAGITGCTVAHRLARHGIASVVCERSAVAGGLVRSARLDGVLYEPHGSHVFHTDDDEVWRLATSLTPFNDYRHRVAIVVEGRLLNWPILLSDLDRQSRSGEIRAQLEARRHVDPAARAAAANFEEWCLALMGPILYERYVKPYTIKQWGRPPAELRAEWAPRRISVRRSGDPYLFTDRHQGWPSGGNGYTDLIEALLDDPLVTVRYRAPVSLPSLVADMEREGCAAAVLTCALDEFCDERLGPLPWRGIAVRSVHVPHVDRAQDTMVVNYPGLEYPFIRIHETKHASRQDCAGTVLSFEFPGAPGRHYPVEAPASRALNDAYAGEVRRHVGADRVRFAGRLATYRYLDMDECMRQALDCADALAGGAPGGRRR